MAKVYGYQIVENDPGKPEVFKTKEGRYDALLFYVEQNWGDFDSGAFYAADIGNDPVTLYFELVKIKTGNQALYLFESEIEDFEDEYPVERAITMSTRHMPGRNADFSSFLYAWDETGHAYVVQIDTEEKMAEAPEWMAPAVAYAYDRKCQFIIFDPLADEIEGIPTYEWEDMN